MKALASSGIANPENSAVQPEILKRHPEGLVLVDSDLPDLPPTITVTAQSVFRALKASPKGSSPGGFQLWTQHQMLYLVYSSGGTRLLTSAYSSLQVSFVGQGLPRVAPWLCGAPNTALYRKNGGVHPIAICETIR